MERNPPGKEENSDGQAEGAPIQPNFLFLLVPVSMGLLDPSLLSAILSFTSKEAKERGRPKPVFRNCEEEVRTIKRLFLRRFTQFNWKGNFLGRI